MKAKTEGDVKYYCRHCGHKTLSKHWSGFFGYRCPACSASTPPKEW